MLIDPQDLQVGDEIVISAFSRLKYLKILKLPVAIGYTFKCSYYRKNHPTIPEYSYPAYNDNVKEHNSTMHIKLGGRDILLMRRCTDD